MEYMLEQRDGKQKHDVANEQWTNLNAYLHDHRWTQSGVEHHLKKWVCFCDGKKTKQQTNDGANAMGD